jgi:hypothetical protein
VRELKRLIELGKQMKRDHHLVQEVAAKWLRIRDRNGRPVPLIANAAQLQYESRRGQQNIVLKARQNGHDDVDRREVLSADDYRDGPR